jgi:hypothetical protein
MWVRVIVGQLVLGCVAFGVGCSSSKDDDEQKEEGALPCNQSAAECRANFADTYQGAYAGDASGSLILSADESGEIVGTATSGDGSFAIFGSVNQFGKLTGEADDGTRFVGQIDESGRVTGTWEGPAGSGTFTAVGTKPVTIPPGSGSGGSGSGGASSGGSPSGGSQSSNPLANDPRFTPSVAVICAASEKCGDDPATCEETVLFLRELVAEAGCIEELNGFFTCVVNSGQCGMVAECQAAYDTLNACGG